jgi:hypothetical protein
MDRRELASSGKMAEESGRRSVAPCLLPRASLWLSADSVLQALRSSFFDRHMRRGMAPLTILCHDGCMAHLNDVFKSYGSFHLEDKKRCNYETPVTSLLHL